MIKNSNGERDTDFIPCVVYRQLAELCANFLSKGKLASVDGRLQVRSFEGQDGQRRWVTEVIAENVQFLSPKENGNSGNGTSGNAGNVGGASNVGTYGHEVSLDDDIPF
jgi:single-strand DNA-binding protein